MFVWGCVCQRLERPGDHGFGMPHACPVHCRTAPSAAFRHPVWTLHLTTLCTQAFLLPVVAAFIVRVRALSAWRRGGLLRVTVSWDPQQTA